MEIKSLRIKGFKCFKDETYINFDKMTCFVGTNGSGKTAAMEALCRLFGDNSEITKIKKNDFYTDSNIALDKIQHKDLFIEVIIKFPDLLSEEGEVVVPEVFTHMTINGEGEMPFCRIRLEASWEQGDTLDGKVDSSIYWITTNSDEINEDNKIRFRLSDFNLIKVHYIPATRDPSHQIKLIAGSVIQRLFSAINWKNSASLIEEYAMKLQEEFDKETCIKIIQDDLANYWTKYAGDGKYQNIKLSPIELKKDSLFKHINAQFSPGDTENYDSVEQLSDGTKSLFYLSLLNTLFDIEDKAKRGIINDFDKERMSKAYLTIFALEEPENHLAPHYLGRIINIFRELCSRNSQTIISSHSPSIISRIEPEEIRYFKLYNNDYTKVKEIELPRKTEIQFEGKEKTEKITTTYKYIKGAVQAYPELYFSKLVILGEGESEQLIMPQLAKQNEIDIDTSFTSFVPLGGRFVNHFWKLLEHLEIPYITLLDFDKGRNTGGEDKFKYIANELFEYQKIDKEKFDFIVDNDISEITRIKFLERYNVFFSYPLDIDYYMLQNFFEEYTNKKDYPDGPRIPDETDAKKVDKDKSVIASVLKTSKELIPDDYDVKNIELYYWYRYLFLNSRGKPSSHLIGLSNIIENKRDTNNIYKDLFNKVKFYLK